jgi:hypothetical protein
MTGTTFVWPEAQNEQNLFFYSQIRLVENGLDSSLSWALGERKLWQN